MHVFAGECLHVCPRLLFGDAIVLIAGWELTKIETIIISASYLHTSDHTIVVMSWCGYLLALQHTWLAGYLQLLLNVV